MLIVDFEWEEGVDLWEEWGRLDEVVVLGRWQQAFAMMVCHLKPLIP